MQSLVVSMAPDIHGGPGMCPAQMRGDYYVCICVEVSVTKQ